MGPLKGASVKYLLAAGQGGGNETRPEGEATRWQPGGLKAGCPPKPEGESLTGESPEQELGRTARGTTEGQFGKSHAQVKF